MRARYVQPYEDNVLGGGVAILDAGIEAIERAADGTFDVRLRRTDGGGDMDLQVDEVISATGFVCPLLDLPDLGVATFGQSRLPRQTAWWESASVPGIFFAGTIGQAAKGLQRHGIPANSGAVHGARYNARVLAGHLAETRFGRRACAARPSIRGRSRRPHRDRADRRARALASARLPRPGLHRRPRRTGSSTTGCSRSTEMLDAGGPDAVAITLEADGTGAIYPVLYRRIGGVVTERVLEPDPLLRYDGAAARRAIADAISRLVPGGAAG